LTPVKEVLTSHISIDSISILDNEPKIPYVSEDQPFLEISKIKKKEKKPIEIFKKER